MAFSIVIKPSAQEDIEYYRANEQRIIVDGIKLYLSDQPNTESKRKKPLRPNQLAPWELRIDIYRIFYVIEGAHVVVVAIGHKVHNKLYIRGKEVNL